MIKFMWKDFEEADMMVEKIYEEERHIIAKLGASTRRSIFAFAPETPHIMKELLFD